MTNTENPIDTLRIGMHIQLENGSIHQIINIKIKRTPKLGLIREASFRSNVALEWIDLTTIDWRVVSPLAGVIRGSHNSVDGLHHSQSCTGILTTVRQMPEGWSKECRRCGFSVIGYASRELAEAAYTADQVEAFH